MPKTEAERLVIEGREISITNPRKVLFPQPGYTKLDLARYYLAVSDGALRAAGGRPNVLVRYPNGIDGDFFFQKRAPTSRPDWIDVVTLRFPSGRVAEEVVPRDAAALAWMANLACLELHPHPVRAEDLDHPDELRVDLDPVRGVPFGDVRTVAHVLRGALDDFGLIGWPKTSGSRGMHVNVRIEQKWTFTEVRRAALALSREIERRAPKLATSKWWKEERHGVFLDYNQNAKDRTTCSAYSIRPLPDARVSAPLAWDEVPDSEPADFTVPTMPGRFKSIGDPNGRMDDAAGSLDQLLEIAARDEAAGLGDAPWPPHFRKMEGEPARVAPSRAKGVKGVKGSKAAKTAKKSARKSADKKSPAAKSTRKPRSKMPLVVVANSPDKAKALAGLERWRKKHPGAVAHLAIDDVLVDSMRGRSTTWTRVRVNLRNVPEEIRPLQETPDPDDDPTREWRESKSKGR